MNKNILSVAISLTMTFSIGSAAAAEGLSTIKNPCTVDYKPELVNYKDYKSAQSENQTAGEIMRLAIENAANEKVSAVSDAEAEQQTSDENCTESAADSVSYSENDIYWLSRLIEAEASGESLEGKKAVGACVMNRVKSSQFPNSVYGVIFDKNYGVQYQPTANGAIYNTPSADSVRAAAEALCGNYTANGAMYFCNTTVAPRSWAAANRAYCMTLGNHVFYY